MEPHLSLTSLAHGTAFEFDRWRIEILSNLVRAGTAWMVRGKSFDFGVIGREIARSGKDSQLLIEAFPDLIILDPERRNEFERILAGLDPQGTEPGLMGNRYFWRSDYISHRRSGYFISTRMASSRVWRTDGVWGGGEGKQSHYLADGATAIYRDGHEYFDIFPLWSWRRVPGVTAIFDGSDLKVRDMREMGTRSFVGGLSDGTYGLTAMDYFRNGLQAHKAWFFQEEGMLALGAGLSNDSTGWVATTINQTFRRGLTWIGGDGRGTRLWTQEGDSRFQNGNQPSWFFHDQIGYVLNPSHLGYRLDQGEVNGNWNLISDPAGNVPAHGQVFTLGLEHGMSPHNQTYAYAVLPGVTLQDLEQHWSGPSRGELGSRIISNTLELQAVQDARKDLVQAVFWAAGSLNVQGGLQISVSHPSVVQTQILDRDGPSPRIRLTVASPDHSTNSMRVRVNRWLLCDTCQRASDRRETDVLVTLPEGGMAGSSVVRVIQLLD